MKLKNRKFLHFALLLIILLIAGCSSVAVQSESSDEIVIKDENEEKRKALSKFLDGTSLEAKGDYSGAILEYQEALQFEKSSGIYYSLAKNYFYLNKLSLALQHINSAINLEKENVEYYLLQQEIYSKGRQNDSAQIVLEKIIEMDASQVNAYYKLGRLLETSQPARAIEVYKKLLKIIGDEWTVLIRVAELYERIGDYENTITTIKKLLEIDPSNLAIQKLLVESLFRYKKYDEAMQIVDDILKTFPDDLDARERKAQIYLALDKWKEASAEYQALFDQEDISLEAKVRIGAAYFAESFRDSSLLAVAKNLFIQLDNDTTDWQIKMYLGAVYLSENQDTLALKYFSEVIDLAPWNVEAWIRMGGIYFDNARYDDAITLLNNCIDRFPQDFAINFLLGISYAQSAKYEDAKIYLGKSIKLNDNDPNALSAYGFALSQLKENDTALIYLKKALIVDPENINVLGQIGLIYDGLGNYEDSDNYYSRAIKIDSNDATVNNNYAYSLSKRKINLDVALLLAQKAIEKEPENSAFLDTIGWVYFALENYSKAIEYIQKAVDFGGERPVILEHLGDALFMNGETERAIEVWKRALELDNSNQALKNKIERGNI